MREAGRAVETIDVTATLTLTATHGTIGRRHVDLATACVAAELAGIELTKLTINETVYAFTATKITGEAGRTVDLNTQMEFDHVIEVHADGTVIDAPDGIYAPELHDTQLESGTGWSLMNGYSGQYGYSGPGMHPSEFIGGGLERDIRATPGYYVALVDYPSDGSEPNGWAVAYRPAHVDYPHLPGWLYDCEACESGPCTCDATTAPCVSRHCVNPDA